MNKKEIFPYEIELGTIMDYVDDHFMLIIKDEFWADEELKLLETPLELNFCYTQDIAIFVLEGGDIDSSDFYFNIQDCDWKDKLLSSELIDIEVLLLNDKNEVCWKRRKTLNAPQSKVILDCLSRQNGISFMPDEFDVNVQGIQSAYEPFELNKYSKVNIKF